MKRVLNAESMFSILHEPDFLHVHFFLNFEHILNHNGYVFDTHSSSQCS